MGQDPGPGDGEPVGLDPHVLDELCVLLVLEVAVDAVLAVGAVVDHGGLQLGEGVPDARALALGVPCALDLKGLNGSILFKELIVQ